MNQQNVLLMYVQRMIFKRIFEYLDNYGLMSLAAFLEERGYRSRVFTGITTDAVRVFEMESQKHPILAVGLYCDYDNQSAVASLSRLLKEKHGVKVVVGGPQTFNLGKEFILESKCDALVRGDGEWTLLELLEWMTKGRGEPSLIAGIVYLDQEGREVTTPPRPLIEDLDALPLPKVSHLLQRPSKYNISVLSARGCPYRCAFCFEGGNTKTLRTRSVQKVCDEIRRGLDETPEAKYVWFVDDTFTLNYKRTAEFCEALKSIRQERDFIWFCEGHARILSKWPQLVPMMMDAGMARMQIGMESGWQPALDMYRKQASVAQIEEVIHTCWQAGLPQLHGNFIVGGARETAETLELTTSHAERLLRENPGMLDVSTTFVMPLPNTEIFNCPARFGQKILDPESLTSMEDFPVTETETLSRQELCLARFNFVKRISDTLKDLFKQKKIPQANILRHFELALRYKVASTWYKYLYSRDALTYQYFSLLVNTSAESLSEVPPGQLDDRYPCRAFDMATSLDYSGETLKLGGMELSDIEHELLQLCDGRTVLGKIKEHLRSVMNKEISDSAYAEMLPLLLKKFADNYWVVFIPAG